MMRTSKSEVPNQTVLQAAIDDGVQSVIVIGFYPNGDLYFSSSSPNAAEISFLLKRAERRLHDEVDKEMR
jgi:hypothetical protein